MDGMEAVVEEPIEGIGEPVEEGLDLPEEPAEVEGQEQPVKDDPYTTKFAREYRAALKQLETAHPEQAKYLKQARDNHARLFALNQIDPKGIDGVRERYALLDSLAHGETKGADAIAAMQERIQASDEVDTLLAAGDPKAFESLGEDFNEGLAKLAPAYLDRIEAANPEAYSKAVLPHFVKALAASDLVKEYNDLVDILNTKDDPRLDDATKMRMTLQKLGAMGQWMNAQQTKAGEITTVTPAGKDTLAEERTKFEQERQDHHWNTSIKPVASQHEASTFENLFKPYQTRLKLDAGAKVDLLQAFKAGLNKAGSADQDYLRQMKLYRSQKNPDAAAVSNYVKNAINKHSKTVMESLVKARYGSFLAGKQQKPAAQTLNGKPQAPVAANVEIRTVKPPMDEIDHKRTPISWLHQRKYYLTSGKIVQVQ